MKIYLQLCQSSIFYVSSRQWFIWSKKLSKRTHLKKHLNFLRCNNSEWCLRKTRGIFCYRSQPYKMFPVLSSHPFYFSHICKKTRIFSIMEKRGRNIFYKFIVRTYQHEFIVTILDVQIDMNDAQCYFRSMAVCHHHVTFFDLIIFLLSVYRKCRIWRLPKLQVKIHILHWIMEDGNLMF